MTCWRLAPMLILQFRLCYPENTVHDWIAVTHHAYMTVDENHVLHFRVQSGHSSCTTHSTTQSWDFFCANWALPLYTHLWCVFEVKDPHSIRCIDITAVIKVNIAATNLLLLPPPVSLLQSYIVQSSHSNTATVLVSVGSCCWLPLCYWMAELLWVNISPISAHIQSKGTL